MLCSTFVVSLYRNYCINFFSAFFCMTFLSGGIAASVSMHVFSFLFLFITSHYLPQLLYLCVPLDSITLSHLHVHILVWACVFTTFLLFRCLVTYYFNYYYYCLKSDNWQIPCDEIQNVLHCGQNSTEFYSIRCFISLNPPSVTEQND